MFFRLENDISKWRSEVKARDQTLEQKLEVLENEFGQLWTQINLMPFEVNTTFTQSRLWELQSNGLFNIP